MEVQNLLFENYILGELSKEEISEIEQRLETDKKFKEDFNLYLKITSFLDHKIGNEIKTTAFKQNLEKITTTYFDTKSRKRISPWYYSVAASFLLIFSLYFYSTNKNPTYGDFVNYETIELVTRSNENALFIKAETAFNAKEFKEASNYFSQILKNNPENIEVEIYNAFALLETNQFKKADITLQKIGQGTSVYKNQAIWYLALSKLKQEQYDGCIKILKMISKDTSEYKKAKKLLSKLE